MPVILALLLACSAPEAPAPTGATPDDPRWKRLYWLGHLGAVRRADTVPDEAWAALQGDEDAARAKFEAYAKRHADAAVVIRAALQAGAAPDAAAVEALVEADQGLRITAVEAVGAALDHLGPADDPAYAPAVAARHAADGMVELMLRGHPGTPTPDFGELPGLPAAAVDVGVAEARRGGTLDAAMLRYQADLAGMDLGGPATASALSTAATALGEALDADKRERLRAAGELFAAADPPARDALLGRDDVLAWLDLQAADVAFPLAFGREVFAPPPGDGGGAPPPP